MPRFSRLAARAATLRSPVSDAGPVLAADEVPLGVVVLGAALLDPQAARARPPTAAAPAPSRKVRRLVWRLLSAALSSPSASCHSATEARSAGRDRSWWI